MSKFVPTLEPGGRESIVDKLGYVKAEVRIKRMLQAGVRFAAAGADVYDGFEEDGEIVVPPWRRKDFDIAEASQFLRSAVKRKDDLLRYAAMAKIDAGEVGTQSLPVAAQQQQEGAGGSLPAGVQGQGPALDAKASQ